MLTGIHLMRTGEVEPNLVTLNAEAKLPWVNELIAQKLAGAEHGALSATDIPFHMTEVARLRTALESAMDETFLPETAPGVQDQLHDLLVRIRLQSVTHDWQAQTF